MDHSKCSISTGIDGSLTAGQGKLDQNGYWQFPCDECRLKVRNRIMETGMVALDRIARDKGEGEEFFAEMARQVALLERL